MLINNREHNNKFSKECYTKYILRVQDSLNIKSFDDATIISNRYLSNNDKIGAICLLGGWGINKLYNSDIMIQFFKDVNKKLSASHLKKLNTPYRHKIYYLGKDKHSVTVDLFLSIINYGNKFSDNWVVTNGKKIPITKAMCEALVIMIDIVKD